MRIAIIGGGSAGLVTAHLLDGVHDVTVFEKAPILGGHVRTLNRNVSCDLDPDILLDAGVIEFERHNFPTLMRLFDSLGCETRTVPGTTTFWTHDGEHHLSQGSIRRAHESVIERLRQRIDLVSIHLQELRFNKRTGLPDHELRRLTLGDLLTDSDADRWAALLATYAYSIPYERVRDMPAGLTIPMLRAFERAEEWVSLVGGSWDYLRRIVARFSGTIHTEAKIASVNRREDRVTLRLATGESVDFDKVVLAAPPDQVLKLLADPSEAETRRFGPWRANHTPDYSVEAHRWHVEVSQTNGENRTFHVGAWLGDGLQEGAVTSALAVSRLLGGASIP